MKKVLAIAFIGGLLVANCSKKPNHDLQDSNTMLPEPDAPTVVQDSSATTRDTPEADVNAAMSVPANEAKADTLTK
ncbi:hypothetical protein EG349_05425 [Chryseobacterium shandongense]|jgi:uncharacterized protein YcfL|uniref:Cytochrome C551 n=1 Tax=Chryseobacterium shandongense TaxID=1493872 RepID=A0A3G6Q970_9FLAO|nr:MULTISPECIES: hypothetical protein [Chryseobacterium]AZA58018.1 hypothetical protein EG350_12870 [Chryseobacterium shandongense]AZA86265.1 hypothetical protein EG349_05425 [Chryseobacterium shandongense]AZA94675.1 hypothetical protein EG353_03445 [Chryseobacterium shandongense]